MADLDQQQRKKKDDAAEARGGKLGYVLGFLLGLACLAGVLALAKLKTEPPGPHELPIITIMVEVNQLDAETRREISMLEVKLKDMGTVDVDGPADQKYLIPPHTPAEMPQTRTFEALTQEEWEAAWRYFSSGDWLVPRYFRLDGKAYVVRVAPKKGTGAFAPNAAAEVDRIAHAMGTAHYKNIYVYSKTAGLGTDADRDAINVTFGVTTAWVVVSRGGSAPGNPLLWRTADGMKLLKKAKPAVSVNKHMRSVVTPVSWLQYFVAVRTKRTGDVDVPDDAATIDQAFGYAHANQIQSLLTDDGAKALVATTGDAEGRDNAELQYYLASTMQDTLRADVEGYRPTLPNGPAPEPTQK